MEPRFQVLLLWRLTLPVGCQPAVLLFCAAPVFS